MENHDHHAGDGGKSGVSGNPAWPGAAIMAAAIVAFYVLREHWGHVLGLAPYLLLLACPLMHLFGHGGHGRHHGRDDREPRP